MTKAAIGLAVFLAVWWSLVALFDVPAYLVPSPVALGEKFWFLSTRGGLFSHIPVTASEILIGFAIGVAAGVLTAVLFVKVRMAEVILNPVIILVQTAPKIAIAPLLLLWLGLGATPKVVLVAIVTFFPVLANMTSAFRSLDPNYLALAQVLKLSAAQRFWRIELPQSLPLLFAGMKVGVTLAVTAAVIGELMGARAGLGYLLSLGQETADVGMVLVAVILLSLIGYILYLLLAAAERRLLGWHESRDELETLSVA